MWQNDQKNLESWSLSWFMHWLTVSNIISQIVMNDEHLSFPFFSYLLNNYNFYNQCEVAAERQRCIEGIKKSTVLVEESGKKLAEANDRIREIEEPVSLFKIMCLYIKGEEKECKANGISFL